jgi:hypothetical protein
MLAAQDTLFGPFLWGTMNLWPSHKDATNVDVDLLLERCGGLLRHFAKEDVRPTAEAVNQVVREWGQMPLILELRDFTVTPTLLLDGYFNEYCKRVQRDRANATLRDVKQELEPPEWFVAYLVHNYPDESDSESWTWLGAYHRQAVGAR